MTSIALMALGLIGQPSINRLGDPRCLIRDRVQAILTTDALTVPGFRVELEQAAKEHRDPEVRMRARAILRRVGVEMKPA